MSNHSADAVSFGEHVAGYLDRAGQGTLQENIFCQARPDEPDALLVVTDTGASPPDPHCPLEERTVQVLARAASGDGALQRLSLVVGIFLADDGCPVTNFYLDEEGYIWVNIVQPLGLPALLGLDEKGRALASVNFQFEIRRR